MSPDVFSAARHDAVRQYRRTCSIASVAENNLGDCITTADTRHRSVLTAISRVGKGKHLHVTKLSRDAAPVVCADGKVLNRQMYTNTLKHTHTHTHTNY